MANGIRTGDSRGFNKGRSSKLRVNSRVQQTPEEGWRTYRPKRCGNNNKDEDNSPKTLTDKNHQDSSKKFRQLTSANFVMKCLHSLFTFFGIPFMAKSVIHIRTIYAVSPRQEEAVSRTTPYTSKSNTKNIMPFGKQFSWLLRKKNSRSPTGKTLSQNI